MKLAHLGSIFTLLTLCLVSISCTTIYPDSNAVSDAWLDTPPRRPDRQPRRVDGVTDWLTGLPHAEKQGVSVSQASLRRLSRDLDPAGQGASDRADRGSSYHGTSRYVSYDPYRGGGYLGYSGHGNHGRKHHHRSRGNHGNQNTQRTVEKVGPPIVPRSEVRTVDLAQGAVSEPTIFGPTSWANGSQSKKEVQRRSMGVLRKTGARGGGFVRQSRRD